MYSIPVESVKVLEAYDCQVRTSMHSQIATYNKKGELDEILVPSTIVAEIIDIVTGESYIQAAGDDRLDATIKAIAKIPETAKPLTRSQRLVASNNVAATAKDDEISRLKAENEALRAHVKTETAIGGLVPDAQLTKVAALAGGGEESEPSIPAGLAPARHGQLGRPRRA